MGSILGSPYFGKLPYPSTRAPQDTGRQLSTTGARCILGGLTDRPPWTSSFHVGCESGGCGTFLVLYHDLSQMMCYCVYCESSRNSGPRRSSSEWRRNGSHDFKHQSPSARGAPFVTPWARPAPLRKCWALLVRLCCYHCSGSCALAEGCDTGVDPYIT